ncbi:SHOCT domain-containing protein [Terrabacter carboxydivorans]|uniref:SHOCT domain-containing protein n=1 Tax=Terrabacter carboxydivorans TaxID=619730 RepID=A0ABP5YJ44_9MICO
MMWNTGLGMGAGLWLVMALGTVAFWVVVAMAVRGLLSARPRPRRAPAAEPLDPEAHRRGSISGSTAAEPHAALTVLQDRLARGEIDVDEYARIRRTLVQSQPSLATDVADPGHAAEDRTRGDLPHAS